VSWLLYVICDCVCVCALINVFTFCVFARFVSWLLCVMCLHLSVFKLIYPLTLWLLCVVFCVCICVCALKSSYSRTLLLLCLGFRRASYAVFVIAFVCVCALIHTRNVFTGTVDFVHCVFHCRKGFLFVCARLIYLFTNTLAFFVAFCVLAWIDICLFAHTLAFVSWLLYVVCYMPIRACSSLCLN